MKVNEDGANTSKCDGRSPVWGETYVGICLVRNSDSTAVSLDMPLCNLPSPSFSKDQLLFFSLPLVTSLQLVPRGLQ